MPTVISHEASKQDYYIRTEILEDHRNTFKCKWTRYRAPERTLTKAQYRFIDHEIRYRRFMEFRKHNQQDFYFSEWSQSSLDACNNCLALKKKHNPLIYAHLLKENHDAFNGYGLSRHGYWSHDYEYYKENGIR